MYCKSAMGMSGSETALEELMCRVLGNLDGIVAKLHVADDLCCGGNLAGITKQLDKGATCLQLMQHETVTN